MPRQGSAAIDKRWTSFAPAWATLLLGVLISIGLSWWLLADARLVDEARFRSAVTRLMDQLDERTERYAMELERFANQAGAHQDVNAIEWDHLLQRFGPESRVPALVELAWATNTELWSRAELERRINHARTNRLGHKVFDRSTTPDVRVIHHWTHGIQMSPEKTTDWLNKPDIKYVWRGSWNGKLIASPVRHALDAEAQSTATVTFFVAQFMDDLAELRARHPEFGEREFHDARFQALIFGTISWPTFLRTALSGEGHGNVGFEAFGATDISPQTYMGRADGGPSRFLADGFSARFQEAREWRFFRQRWKVVFYSTPEFEKISPRYRAYVALASGVMLSICMAGLVGVQIRARLKQEVVSEQLQGALTELDAAKKEREELSHDLHDGAIQSLYALQLGLSRAAGQARTVAPGLGEELAEHRRNLASVIGELRGFILRHENQEGPSGDLAGVIEALVGRLKASTESELEVKVSREAARRLTSEEAVHLANIAREALSNALRHAHARRIRLSLIEEDDVVLLEVKDNGCGFEPDVVRRGVGMESMGTRAKAAGGEMRLESKPGHGTRVCVCVPVGQRAGKVKSE